MKPIVFLLTLMILAAPAFATTRSEAAKHAFMKMHPCPSGPDKGSTTRCKGHVVDHKKALDCGGLDTPSNMQWQTTAQGKAKDKIERNGPECKHPTKAKLLVFDVFQGNSVRKEA
jgi:hypothetical protein